VVGEDDKAQLTRTVQEDLTRTVTGSQTITSEGNIVCVFGKATTENVGGSRITKCVQGGIGCNVGGTMNTTTKGNVTRTSGTGMGFSAKQSNLRITGTSSYQSSEQITLRSDFIHLEAANLIELKSGALKIALTPFKIAVEGKMTIDAANSINTSALISNITK